jgi:hypothetical protein
MATSLAGLDPADLPLDDPAFSSPAGVRPCGIAS